MKLIQQGNSKLGKDMMMFNLPATENVCGRVCDSCYAINEQNRFTNVLKARDARYKASLQPTFTSTVKAELKHLRKPPKYFRIHASGEFYDQAYINKWASIVKSFPDVIFYAYTKRLGEFDFSSLTALPNFVLINSLHFGAKNYGKKNEVPLGAFVCPDGTNQNVQCGKDCKYCQTKGKADIYGVYFIKH